MQHIKHALFLTILIVFSCCSRLADGASSENHAFVRVSSCQRDYAQVDFCDALHLKAINLGIKDRKPDFHKKYIFLTIPMRRGGLKSAVIIDITTGIAYPLPFDYFGGYVDRKGLPIKNIKAQVIYSSRNNKVCFYGSTYAYRDTVENMVSCYTFDGNDWDKQPTKK